MNDAVPPCYKAARVAKLNCLATDPSQNEPVPASGRVWLLEDNPREPEVVFDFPFHEELNEAVKELPRRWFDWRRKHWRVPAHPRVAKQIEALLGRFPELVPSPEVLAWLSDSDRWRAICTVVARDGRGHVPRAHALGRLAAGARGAPRTAGEGRLLLPVRAPRAPSSCSSSTGVRLDDLARGVRARAALRHDAAPGRAVARDRRGRRAATSRSSTSGTARPATDFRELLRGAPGAPARPLLRCATPPGASRCRPTRRSRPQLAEFVEAHPQRARGGAGAAS